MADSILNVIINMVKKGSGDKQAQAGLKGLSDGFRQLTGFSLGSVSALAAVGMGLREVVKFGKEAVNETVAYNKTIREMTQVTGLGAEEISRIVQVGDDWGISIETLRTSLAFMNKTGVTPSIDNLAKLADEYVATSDKSAFAEKAVKLLGRGYQTLIPLLALGGDGFRDATAAIKDNMLATEQSIAASRKYEVAVDDLTDAWTGFKYTVGNKVIPILTDVMKAFVDVRNEEEKQVDIINRLKEAEKERLITQAEVLQALYDMNNGTKSATEVTQEYSGVLNNLAEYELGLADDAFKRYTYTVIDNTDAVNGNADATNRAAISIVDLSKAAFANEAMDALTASYLAGTTAADVYHNKMAYLMGDFLGMPEAEVTAALALQDLKENQLGPGALTADKYSAALIDLYNQLMKLDGTSVRTNIHITTYHEDMFKEHNYQQGGSFMIPPGYPNDSYPLGRGHYAESGEIVTVTPTKYTTNNFNMNVHTNASVGALSGSFAMMKALAG